MGFFEYCNKDAICPENTFSSFDLSHIIVLIITAIILGVLISKRKEIFNNTNKDKIGIGIGVLLLFLDFSFYIWKWANGNQPHFPIPMHLCSWATYLVALSLFTRNEKLFQISFFYGVTGGLLSLIEPGFGAYSFTQMRFYQFFMLHIIILVAPLYQYFAYKRKLSVKYMGYTLILMFAQAGLAAWVNVFTEKYTGEVGNMMFVYEPPIPLPIETPWYLFIFAILFFGLWVGFKKVLEVLDTKS